MRSVAAAVPSWPEWRRVGQPPPDLRRRVPSDRHRPGADHLRRAAAGRPAGRRVLHDLQQTSNETPHELPFEADLTALAATDEPTLVVDVEGFEGPLDILLMLARQQRVDLAKISILALADQYLTFIEEARRLRLELAADYLVMAAWLAYLKSRLLPPESHAPEGQSAEDTANALHSGSSGWKRSGRWPSACSGCRSSIATFSIEVSPNRSRTSSVRNGQRPCTTCSPPTPPSARSTRLPACMLPNARCGSWPRPVTRSSG
jgi:hypothetical protein